MVEDYLPLMTFTKPVEEMEPVNRDNEEMFNATNHKIGALPYLMEALQETLNFSVEYLIRKDRFYGSINAGILLYLLFHIVTLQR